MDSLHTVAKGRVVEDLNMGRPRKRVRIDPVVSLPESAEDEKKVLSHPSLLEFGRCDGIDTGPLGAMNLSVVQHTTEGRTIKTKEDLECIAENAKGEWRGRKASNEMNHEYFIGVRNKRTDVLQLFQVDAQYSLRPFVLRSRDIDEQIDVSRVETTQTYGEKRAELLQSFGGKKSKKRLEKYERDRITDANVDEKAQEQLNIAAGQMKERDAAQGIHHLRQETTEEMAPPHDNDAAQPHNAYPLEGLMSAVEYAALTKEVNSMVDACAHGMVGVDNPGWHDMVWVILVKHVLNRDLAQEDKVRCMRAAMHLHYLVVMAHCPDRILPRDMLFITEQMAVEKQVLEAVLDRFTIAEKKDGKVRMRRKTEACKTRIIVYSIVMWLTTNGFSKCGDLDELSKALGISLKLLLSHAVHLGCKVKQKKDNVAAGDASGYRLSLPVPLKFPARRKRQGRPAKRS